MLVSPIVVLLILCGIAGYYGNNRWGSAGGAGAGLGAVLIVLLAAYILGGVRMP